MELKPIPIITGFDPAIVPTLAAYIAHERGTIIMPILHRRPEMMIPPADFSFAKGDRIQCTGETALLIQRALQMPKPVPGRLEWLRYKFPTGVVSTARLL